MKIPINPAHASRNARCDKRSLKTRNTIDLKALTDCIRKTENDAAVKKLLAAVGVKNLPPPIKETRSGLLGKISFLNGFTKVRATKQGVLLTFDFPPDRDGDSDKPLSFKGPRVLESVTLMRKGARDDGETFDAFEGPVLLDWSIDEPLETLRSNAKEKSKAYAPRPGKTPDSIRIGKVLYVIERQRGDRLAERIVLSR